MPSKTFSQRLDNYIQLTRLNKPIGILLLLWPTLWSLWLAGDGQPDGFIVLIFVLGVILMRSAGCVINDYADRDFDRHVKRTSQRPLTSGRIDSKEALLLFAVLSLLSFALVLFLNSLTIMLSVGGIFLAASYPFMKRYTHLPQAYLGIAFGWAAPMAFAALHGELDSRLWLIFSATVIWALSYDTMYAMVDRDDDIKIGVRSTAILFGQYDRIAVAILQIALLINLVIIGLAFDRQLAYFAGVLLAAMLSIYHQWLIRERERQACFKAFLHNNWLGAVVFAGLLLDYQIFG